MNQTRLDRLPRPIDEKRPRPPQRWKAIAGIGAALLAGGYGLHQVESARAASQEEAQLVAKFSQPNLAETLTPEEIKADNATVLTLTESDVDPWGLALATAKPADVQDVSAEIFGQIQDKGAQFGDQAVIPLSQLRPGAQ